MTEETKDLQQKNDTPKQVGSQEKMGTMPMFKLIMSMSLPSMFSMLVNACYNIVDSIYVSRLGEFALSAVSIVYPVQLLNVAISVGTGIGLSSLISRRLGEKRVKDAQAAANHGLYICFFHYLIFLFFGLFLTKAFCGMFANPETEKAIYDASVSYCRIICLGSFFIMTASSFEKIMQAGGNMMAPMWCMLAGAVTNLILDPIMIFGLLGCPALGVAGAAYATVIGQFVSFLVANIFMVKKHMPVRVQYKLIKLDWPTIKDIYEVGFPSMVMQAIASVTTLALNGILITFSSTAVAVLGVYFKLQTFVFMPVFGMNHGLLPIMGYNYGSKNKKRLLQAYQYGSIIAICILSFGTIIFNFFPAQLMSLFKAQGDLMTVGIKCLRTISWSFPIAAFCIITGTLFQATAHGFYSLIVSVMRQLVCIVPLAYVLSKVLGLMGIWYSYPLAELVSLLVSLIFYRKLYKNDISKLEMN